MPSLVRILCTLFVVGWIHAASRVSKVVNPESINSELSLKMDHSEQTRLDCFKYFLLWIQLCERNITYYKVKMTWHVKSGVNIYSRIQNPQSTPCRQASNLKEAE